MQINPRELLNRLASDSFLKGNFLYFHPMGKYEDLRAEVLLRENKPQKTLLQSWQQSSGVSWAVCGM